MSWPDRPKRGYASAKVSHVGYVFRQMNRRAYGHHVLQQDKAGARWCGICGRWVVRGMGRWWA